jgi:hypothetical protein
MRPPQLGDIGTVVNVHHEASETALTVECVDGDGYTIWLSGFGPDELELIFRREPIRGCKVPFSETPVVGHGGYHYIFRLSLETAVVLKSRRVSSSSHDGLDG